MQFKHLCRDLGGFIGSKIKRNHYRKTQRTDGRKSTEKKTQTKEEGRRVFSEAFEEKPQPRRSIPHRPFCLNSISPLTVWPMGTQRMAKFCDHWGVDRNDVHLRASTWLFPARIGFFQSRCHFCPRVANEVPFEIHQLISQRAVDCGFSWTRQWRFNSAPRSIPRCCNGSTPRNSTVAPLPAPSTHIRVEEFCSLGL